MVTALPEGVKPLTDWGEGNPKVSAIVRTH